MFTWRFRGWENQSYQTVCGRHFFREIPNVYWCQDRQKTSRVRDRLSTANAVGY